MLTISKTDRSFAPSKDTTCAQTISQSVERDRFFCSFSDIHWRINHLISLVHPQLYSTLSALRPALMAYSSCQKLLSIWSSIFPGYSLICNRATGEYIDKLGIRRGFEAICPRLSRQACNSLAPSTPHTSSYTAKRRGHSTDLNPQPLIRRRF